MLWLNTIFEKVNTLPHARDQIASKETRERSSFFCQILVLERFKICAISLIMKGLRKNQNKDMGDAMISSACANFLSNANLQPSEVRTGGGINGNNDQIVRFVKSRERSHALIEIDDPSLSWADLERRHNRDRAILTVRYRGFYFRETVDGYSKMTLYDITLPEAACRGKSNRGLRLSQLIQLDGKNAAFLQRADPIVLTLRNHDEGSRTELEVRMQDEWSRDNWNF